jgi:hypothetical protein
MGFLPSFLPLSKKPLFALSLSLFQSDCSSSLLIRDAIRITSVASSLFLGVASATR